MDRPARSLPVRRIRFRYPAGSLRHHYAEDDLILSHAVAVLSATFPPGEDFFVRSVRHYSDRSPTRCSGSRCAASSARRSPTAASTASSTERLDEMGYPTHRVARFVKAVLADATKRAPAKLCLSYTAALEHYTATIAECLLTKPEAQDLLGDTEVRNILLWHALEETEHKAVASTSTGRSAAPSWSGGSASSSSPFGLIGLVVIAHHLVDAG